MNSPEFKYEPLKDKVVRLHQLFEENRVGYGFGGALALSYYSEPRATSDIDINVFVGYTHRDGAIAMNHDSPNFWLDHAGRRTGRKGTA